MTEMSIGRLSFSQAKTSTSIQCVTIKIQRNKFGTKSCAKYEYIKRYRIANYC